MKLTDKKKPVNTIPKGVWESSNPIQKENKNDKSVNPSTDLQGNGYPAQKGK